jgi:hypothetical protein
MFYRFEIQNAQRLSLFHFTLTGPKLIEKARPDLIKKYAALTEDGDAAVIANYIFHCNAQNPT